MARPDRRTSASVSEGPLPDFDSPPVAEVVMAAAFEPIDKLDTSQVGLLWKELFGSSFPRHEDKVPVAVQFERFGFPVSEPTVRFRAMEIPPWPRVWFLSKDDEQVVQLQPDWIARNWRRSAQGRPSVYPRYPTLLRRFQRDARGFVRYVQENDLGKVMFTQCELTYINHIDLAPLGLGAGDMHAVLELAPLPNRDSFLPRPEATQLSYQYLIDLGTGPIGRLYVSASPAFRREGGQPILVLTLSAKGPPAGPTLTDVSRFLDTARRWIVRGFTNITRPEMHRAWRRKA